MNVIERLSRWTWSTSRWPLTENLCSHENKQFTESSEFGLKSYVRNPVRSNLQAGSKMQMVECNEYRFLRTKNFFFNRKGRSQWLNATSTLKEVPNANVCTPIYVPETLPKWPDFGIQKTDCFPGEPKSDRSLPRQTGLTMDVSHTTLQNLVVVQRTWIWTNVALAKWTSERKKL